MFEDTKNVWIVIVSLFAIIQLFSETNTQKFSNSNISSTQLLYVLLS